MLHKTIVSKQPAGQVLLLVEPYHTGPLKAFGCVRAMAVSAIDFINATSVGLLCIQSQFIIGLQFGIFSATGEQHRKSRQYEDGRYSPQVTIMSGAQLFENPGSKSGRAEFPDAGRNQTSLRETFSLRRP